ncbi:hypothetical protein pb186bvf_002828 [Paramecium bursaria]
MKKRRFTRYKYEGLNLKNNILFLHFKCLVQDLENNLEFYILRSNARIFTHLLDNVFLWTQGRTHLFHEFDKILEEDL